MILCLSINIQRHVQTKFVALGHVLRRKIEKLDSPEFVLDL